MCPVLRYKRDLLLQLGLDTPNLGDLLLCPIIAKFKVGAIVSSCFKVISGGFWLGHWKWMVGLVNPQKSEFVCGGTDGYQEVKPIGARGK
jgi:hypothetical protein